MYKNKCTFCSLATSTSRIHAVRILLLLFIVILDLTDGMYYSNHQRTEEFSQPTLNPPEPYIVASMSKNATVRRGDPAFLSCMVENLGKYTVSWISQRDLRILTIDRITYTADERFQSLYNAETNEWILHIKWTERKDTGIYECQISTMPVKSLALYLIVLNESELVRRQDDILYDLPVPTSLPETKRNSSSGNSANNGDIYNRMYSDRDYLYLTATTQIVEGTMVYGYKGENLNLTCIINHNYDRRPSYVIWYHQNDIVAYESLRKRDKSPLNSITSYHMIRNVDFDDSGNYTCAPELYGAASTIVHILDGDEMRDVIAGNLVGVGSGFLPRITPLVALVAGMLSLCIFYCHPDKAR
ncbi:zwei Ig domain protein zig-8-like [Ochlerotatus camptorhynchus]|uniref:zwei Ig domain protein zig-8-like n=1 Tax=Ochlerotatus camptorhynchus TaxID=644619 RepID=UPI0031D95B5B